MILCCNQLIWTCLYMYMYVKAGDANYQLCVVFAAQ